MGLTDPMAVLADRTTSLQVLRQAFEEGVPHLAFSRLRPILDFDESSSASAQMPFCAKRLVYGWVFRISGVRSLRRSAADALSKPRSTFPA